MRERSLQAAVRKFTRRFSSGAWLGSLVGVRLETQPLSDRDEYLLSLLAHFRDRDARVDLRYDWQRFREPRYESGITNRGIVIDRR